MFGYVCAIDARADRQTVVQDEMRAMLSDAMEKMMAIAQFVQDVKDGFYVRKRARKNAKPDSDEEDDDDDAPERAPKPKYKKK
jgi:hypothetical protein